MSRKYHCINNTLSLLRCKCEHYLVPRHNTTSAVLQCFSAGFISLGGKASCKMCKHIHMWCIWGEEKPKMHTENIYCMRCLETMNWNYCIAIYVHASWSFNSPVSSDIMRQDHHNFAHLMSKYQIEMHVPQFSLCTQEILTHC